MKEEERVPALLENMPSPHTHTPGDSAQLLGGHQSHTAVAKPLSAAGRGKGYVVGLAQSGKSLQGKGQGPQKEGVSPPGASGCNPHLQTQPPSFLEPFLTLMHTGLTAQGSPENPSAQNLSAPEPCLAGSIFPAQAEPESPLLTAPHCD